MRDAICEAKSFMAARSQPVTKMPDSLPNLSFLFEGSYEIYDFRKKSNLEYKSIT